ncbi:hypothetical protein T4C_1552 [Trichinella pseudospiralis]|uniref:Uncharacterized protein n=1 Tax=Trichinella pseudospiralis TaxID=6337 RepID=A0A0V1JRW7_TRIPS|nr:hypothetical protein T4C_1552 [Trichinella pseudospiralis]
MNRNTHEEERRKVEKATSMERLGWIESLVGQLRLLVKFRHVECRRYDLLKSSVKASSLQRHNE